MTHITDNLLNDYQHAFPLVSEPFGDLARHLDSDVKTVLKRVQALKENGTISRIGPVFKPNTVGVSTLAAISVPHDELDSPRALKAHDITAARELITAIQGGLPLVEKPYLALANELNLTEDEVIDKLKSLILSGTIKRFGVIVRHHEVGYNANAMVVWDVPDEQVDQLGETLGNENCVTLCYQRPRIAPRWPYNLFCMIHGRNRDEVLACISRIRSKHGLEKTPHNILFSGQRFKQRGARYQKQTDTHTGKTH